MRIIKIIISLLFLCFLYYCIIVKWFREVACSASDAAYPVHLCLKACFSFLFQRNKPNIFLRRFSISDCLTTVTLVPWLRRSQRSAWRRSPWMLCRSPAQVCKIKCGQSCFGRWLGSVGLCLENIYIYIL